MDFSGENRIGFDALKYLASMLVHREVALDFIAKGWMGGLLKMPRSSLASLDVGTCFYYMACSSDVMEKVCQLPDQQIDELVDYALWLMNHSNEIGKTAAAMFFTHSFSFLAILERFDQRNGLRHLYNYISTLTRLLIYFQQPILPYKMMQIDEEGLRLALSTLTAFASSPSFSWGAIEEFHRLGFTRIVCSTVNKLKRVFSGRNLMFLSGCPYHEKSVQIAAVNVILLCVGSGIDVEEKPRMSMSDSPPARKIRSGQRAEGSQEFFERIVQSIRKYHGIMVLLANVNSCKQQPESDQYRALNCRLLCSLARHPEVRQILSRLPLFTSNELTEMMKKPIMGEKKAEHANFCSEATNLIAIVTEKSLEEVKRDITQIDDEHVILGTKSGEIHWLNVESGQEEAMMKCHRSAISLTTPSKDGSMLLTSGLFVNPISTLWRLSDTHERMMDFPDEEFVAFNNSAQDTVVGTKKSTATLFDIESGRSTCVMKSSSCKSFAASFSPDDRLILHDTCLFDPRLTNPLINEFERLNLDNGGVFHPHGNEIIINSEVWDVRTFGLLHSVPALDKCQLRFTSSGNVMIAAQQVETRDPFDPFEFSPRLRTFSSVDYSVISTTDFRKTIRSVCLDHSDSSLAVVEVSRHFTPTYTSTLNRRYMSIYRIHEFGRAPDDEGEKGEEDGDEEGNMNETYDPELEPRQSSSSIMLNPNLRRRRRQCPHRPP